MEKENIIKTKSYAFALRIINLYRYLIDRKKEFVLSKQILRSGTSIGANVEESVGCSSRKDFINKMHIAYREGRETLYWLNLLFDSHYLSKESFISIRRDCEELLKILGKIISTTKN